MVHIIKTSLLLIIAAALSFPLSSCEKITENVSTEKEYKNAEHDQALEGWWVNTKGDEYIHFNCSNGQMHKVYNTPDKSTKLDKNAYFNWKTENGLLYIYRKSVMYNPQENVSEYEIRTVDGKKEISRDGLTWLIQFDVE